MKRLIAATLVMAMFMSNSIHTNAYEQDDLIPWVELISDQYCICPELVEAIIFTESSWRPEVSNGSCIGLMQVNPNCHRERMERLSEIYELEQDLKNPYFNIVVGIDYLGELFDEYGEAALVLDYYNGNSKAEYNYENGILSSYAKKVLENSERLEHEHGK